MNYKPFKLCLLNSENSISRVIYYSTMDDEVNGEQQKINIYQDDVVENVKYKLVSQLDDNNIENYYFFAFRNITLNVRELLNNNKSRDGYISYSTFITILNNLNIKDIYYDTQNEYLIEDVNEKLGENIRVSVKIPIGLNYNIYRHGFVVNPLENTFNYTYFNVNETNSELLFECGVIEDNMIYCIHVEEYIKYVEENSMLSLEDTMKIYFKSLYTKNIFSVSELETSQTSLSKKYELYNSLIDAHVLFHEKYQYQMIQNIREKTKITKLEFTYKPKSEIIFPLEIFFRKLQCNQSMPLAKFNPGRTLENIYRLYCPNKDKYGNKIPYFSIKDVRKHQDKIKKEKSVSLIMLDAKKRTTVFHVNSDGEIYCIFENLDYGIDSIAEMTKYSANILNKILALFIKYFDPTSLVYQEFDNIKEDNIEIVEIQYSASLKQKKGKLDAIFFPGILTKVSSNSFNYKRVSNYDKMNDVDATITKMLKKNMDVDYIVEQCSSMFFKNNKQEMRDYLVNFLSSISVSDHMKEDGMKKIYSKNVLNNPGFEIEIKDERNLVFDIKLVNRFEYIDMLLLFLNNLFFIHSNNIEPSDVESHFGEFIFKGAQIDDVIVKNENHVEQKINGNDEKLTSNKKGMDKMFSELLKNGNGYDFDSSSEEEVEEDDDQVEEAEEEAEEAEEEPPKENSEESPEEEGALSDIESLAPEVEVEEDDDQVEIVEQMSDEESEDDGGISSNNSYGSQFGGGEKVKLKNNSKLSKRMIKYQPLLFKSEGKGGQYVSYSRMCPSNVKRQPILITEDEKKEIDEKYPGSYDKVIKYGTNPKKENFYYMCPKYWNFKEMAPVREEDVDPEHLIPEGAKEVDLDDGKYIYKTTDKYTTPGFIQSKRNKHGYFLPCCFGMKDGAKQAEVIKEAEAQMKMIEDTNIDDQDKVIEFLKKHQKTTPKKIKYDSSIIYQLDGTKFPLPKGRYGKLPISIETFLGMNHQSNNCLNENGHCLYRAGIENNEKKSFMIALGYLMGCPEDKNGFEYALEKIQDKITIDNILYFHNGNIPSIFFDKESNPSDIKKYRKSKMYEKYKKNRKTRELNKLISGYENFMRYLEDENEYVDYFYLWDIVSSGILFSDKHNTHVNLIIVRNNDDDITNNVSIICPSSSHSNFSYSERNNTVFMYQKHNMFEPIVVTKNMPDIPEPIIETIISPKTIKENLSSYMWVIMQSIMLNITNKCSITERDRKINYMYEDNVPFNAVVNNTKIKEKYTIHKQIMNFDDKVIAILVSKNDHDAEKFYVPIAPSPLDANYDFVFINDTYWRDYESTKHFLTEFYNESEQQVQCLPKFKITENSLVVGFLTTSNQFVKIDPPREINSVKDNIDEYNDYQYFEVDKILTKHGETDNIREILIKSLKIEAELYNTYVNTIKHLLSKNLNLKKKIREIVASDNFEEGYGKLYEILEKLTDDNFRFVSDKDNMFLKLEQINLCHVLENENSEHCEREDEDMKMLIPKINLYTKEYNNEKYVSSLTFDLLKNEIVRYNVLDSLLNVFNFKVSYAITDEEIILLEKFLLKYYEKLGDKKSKYILQNVFEDMKPQDLIHYLETVEFEFNDGNREGNDEGDDEKEEEKEKEEEHTSPKNNISFDKLELLHKSTEIENERKLKNITNLYEKATELSEKSIQENLNEESISKSEVNANANANANESKTEDDPPVSVSEETSEVKEKKVNDVEEERVEPSLQNDATVEYTLDEIPDDEMVIKLNKKTNKVRLKIKDTQPSEHDVVLIEDEKESDKKELYNFFYHSKCVNAKYMTQYWRGIFPKRTKWLVFDKQMSKCNFNLLIFILKSHNFNKYENIGMEAIKKKLIGYYQHKIFNCKIPEDKNREKRCVKMLEKKWRNEGKGLIDLKHTSIDTIINSEGYILTVIDIILYSYMVNIPLVIYYESKGTVKLCNFEKNNEIGFYYFVYYSSRTNDMYLTIHKKSLKFTADVIGDKITKSLKENSFTDFYSYLFSSF